MRILMLNQAPRAANKHPHYDVETVDALVNSYASPGTKIEIGFPDDFAGSDIFHSLGAESKLNGLHHMVETPAIVRKIVWAQENGYDAVISSNTFDPGVDGGRLAVSIPVIGPLRTSMHAALTLADRVGITVPLASHVPYTRKILRSYGLEGFVSGMKPIGIYGKNLKQRKAEIFDATVKMIRALVDEGAEIILPLGGAIIPYVVDPADLAEATGVQVINTKAVCVRFAEMCVAFKLTHSAIAYPRGTLTSRDFGKPA
jgi:Asp/Glu/hydantoin racemase